MEQLATQSHTGTLADLLRHQYQQLDSEGIEAISPEELAAGVYAQIDPNIISPSLVQWAAVLELRQLARGICRQRQIVAEYETEQRGLFELQPRYPVQRDGRDVYVLRERLTYQERQDNITRLQSEVDTKQAHVDALKAETDQLIAEGKLALPIDHSHQYQLKGEATV